MIATIGAGEVVFAEPWNPYAGCCAEVDGIDWYQVLFAAGYSDWPAFPDAWEIGWVAIEAEDTRHLEVLPPRCPNGEPDLAALTHMTPWERLACFSDRPLTVVGTHGCGQCGGTTAGTLEPMWLADPVFATSLSVEGGVGNSLPLHIPPDSGLKSPPYASIVRLTGHFNDPAASTCITTGRGDQGAADGNPATTELRCREQFVVDGYEVIGTDPDFPDSG